MNRDILKSGLDQLLHFETIGRLKSLKLAGNELGLSQPAVTHSLKKLETSLGVQLCIRTRSGFALTESGKRLYTLSQEIKSGIRGFEKYLENAEGFDGLFSVGILDNIQNNKFESVLVALVKIFPNAKLNIQSYTADEIQDLVSIGELDVGLGIFNHKKPHLSYKHIGTEKICHYISDRHPLWKKKHILDADVKGQHLTWADIVSRDRAAIEIEIFSKNLKSPFYYGSYANNLNAAVFILQTGMSIVSLPEGHLESKIVSFKYRKLNRAFKPFLLKQEIVYQKEFSASSQATSKFLELF